MHTRRLSENRTPTAEIPFWPFFPLIFVKYNQYSPQMIEKNDSKWASLATAPILGQPPGIIGVDLAKDVIQVCVVKHNKVLSNEEMIPSEFISWLANHPRAMVVFKACAMSNYWKQKAVELGHDARLISARLVAQIRQNQKTDKNDALAVAQASQLVDMSTDGLYAENAGAVFCLCNGLRSSNLGQ